MYHPQQRIVLCHLSNMKSIEECADSGHNHSTFAGGVDEAHYQMPYAN